MLIIYIFGKLLLVMLANTIVLQYVSNFKLIMLAYTIVLQYVSNI